MITESIKYYIKNRDLLRIFVLRDLRSKYIGSYLGIFWSVINPLLMLLTFTLVFSGILKVKFHDGQGILNYALYVFCGMLPWLAIQESVLRSTPCLVENSSLVKRPNFPASLLPLHIVISNLINEIPGLAVLAVTVFFSPYHLSSHFFFILPILVLQLLFTLGLVWFLSALNVFFRDTVHFLAVGLTIWMFITPIFYPSSSFPRELGILLAANPLAHLVDLYREVILNNHFPRWDSLGILTFSSIGVFSCGYWAFARSQPKFGDWV